MTEKELAEQLIKWLPELAAGKTLETVYCDGSGHEIASIEDLIEEIQDDDATIRIKQTPIPDAPDSESWQNPDNLTAEQIGIDQGWRLLLKSEIIPRKSADITGWYFSMNDEWAALPTGKIYGSGRATTYRVKADEYPVGSLKPKSEAQLMDDKQTEIIEYLVENGMTHTRACIISTRMVSGKVPHMELK